VCVRLGSNERDDRSGKGDDRNQYTNAFCRGQRWRFRVVCNIFLRHSKDVYTDAYIRSAARERRAVEEGGVGGGGGEANKKK